MNNNPLILEIDNFLSKTECQDLLQISEELGYLPATINTDRGQKRVTGIRNNERVFYESSVLAKRLWSKISPYIPQSYGNSQAIGLNELFRFYRYRPGQLFKKHRDESFIRNESEASYYTFMVYLNDGFTGGQTTFESQTIEPKCGKALIFRHELEHEGSEVLTGEKYVLRSDIMYKLSVDLG